MQSVAATAEGDLFDRILSIGTIPDGIRERDRNGKLAYINRHNTTFTQALYTIYGSKARSINARDTESGQLEDIKRRYTVTVASTNADNHTTFGIANIDRAMIQPNDVLYVHKLYATARYSALVYGQVDLSSTVYPPLTDIPIGAVPVSIHYSTSQGVDGTYPEVRYRDYEQIKVLEVGDFNSHGAGNVKIKVQRFYCAPHSRDLGGMFVHSNSQNLINSGVAANSNSGAITTSMSVFRGRNTFAEGSGNPYGFSKNPERLIDFTQESKYAIDWTEESEGYMQYFNESQMTIAEKLLTEKMAKDNEYAAIFGKKGRVNRKQTGAMEEMMSGGILEHIPTDTAHNHTIDVSTLNYGKWLDFTKAIADLGGSSEWLMCVGDEAYNGLVKAFSAEARLRFSKEESKRFSINIEQIIGSGITIDIMRNRAMSETGRGDEGILLDKNYPIMEPIVYQDWDMKIRPGDDGTTTLKKKVWISIKGWARRFPHYTSHVRFTNIS